MKNFAIYKEKKSTSTITVFFYFMALSLTNNVIANPASLDSERIEIEAGINNFQCSLPSYPWSKWINGGQSTANEPVELLEQANNVAQNIASVFANGVYIYAGYVKTVLDNELIQSNAGFIAGDTKVYPSLSPNYQAALDKWETDNATCGDIIAKIDQGAHMGVGKVESGTPGEYWYTLLIFVEAPIIEVIPAYKNTFTLDTDQDQVDTNRFVIPKNLHLKIGK